MSDSSSASDLRLLFLDCSLPLSSLSSFRSAHVSCSTHLSTVALTRSLLLTSLYAVFVSWYFNLLPFNHTSPHPASFTTTSQDSLQDMSLHQVSRSVLKSVLAVVSPPLSLTSSVPPHLTSNLAPGNTRRSRSSSSSIDRN